jgi:hypothetical protein
MIWFSSFHLQYAMAENRTPIWQCNFDQAIHVGTQLPAIREKKCEWVSGISGRALRLYGNAQFVLPNNIFSSKAGTITFWLRKTGNAPLGDPWPLYVLMNDGKTGPSMVFDKIDVCSARMGEGPAATLPLTQDSDESWHHYAMTWQRGGKIIIYRDGHTPGKGAISTVLDIGEKEFFDNIRFACGQGHPHRYIDIDNINAFDRVIGEDEITQLVHEDRPVICDLDFIQPYQRVMVQTDKQSLVTYGFQALANVQATMSLQTLLINKTIWQERIELNLKKGQKQDIAWTIPFLPGGDVVTLKATLLMGQDNSGPAWAIDMACLPSMSQMSDDLDINGNSDEVIQVDCTSKPDDDFICSAPTDVVENSVGKFRSIGPGRFNWFAYRFKIHHPGQAYRMIIRYPDDMSRTMAFDISDGSGRPPQGAGVMTGGDPLSEQRITQSMRSREVIFWPATENCALFICNWSNDSSAAIAGFTVRHCGPQDMAVDQPLPLPDGLPTREFGTYVEDASMTYFRGGTQKQGAGLAQWKLTVEHLAELMHCTGQNVYYYPISWYSGLLYPNSTDQFGSYTGVRANHIDGSFDIMLNVFEQRGLKFIPSLSLKNNPALYNQTQAPVAKAVAKDPNLAYRYRGENPIGDEILQVNFQGKKRENWLGTMVPGGGRCGPMFNPIHPVVKKVTRQIVADWLEHYSRYPALGGMSFDMATFWTGVPGGESMGYELLFSDYSDYTVNRFSEETGIKVPGQNDDPERYSMRYQFLTSATIVNKWIDWRCLKIHDEVIMPLARMIWETRPDMTVTLTFNGSAKVGSPLWGKKQDWNESLKQCGFDMDMYQNDPRLKVIFLTHTGHMDMSGVGYPQTALPEVMGPLLMNHRAGVIGYWSEYWEEYGNNRYSPANKFWPLNKASITPVRTITEQGMYMLRDGMLALAQSDLCAMLVGGMGVNPLQGHEAEMRRFARAYLALPAVGFEDVAGLADPVRVRQWGHGDDTYVYLVNTEPYPIDVVLNLTTKLATANALDMVSGEQKSLQQADSMIVTVPAYQLVSWKLTGAKVIGGHANVPSQELSLLQEKYQELAFEMKNDSQLGLKLDGVRNRIDNALKEHRLALARALLTTVPISKKFATLPILQWKLVGSFDMSVGDVTVPRPIENDLLQDQPLLRTDYPNPVDEPIKQWEITTDNMAYLGKYYPGVVDVNQYAVPMSLFYAITNLRSDKQQTVTVQFGWDDQGMLWVNNKKIVDEKLGMRRCMGWVPNELTKPIQLKQGDNFIVVKINNGGGPGGFNLSILDEAGNWPKGVESHVPDFVPK